MSATINDGGSAFPLAASTMPNGEYQWQEHGMSLRDWFAGQALAQIGNEYVARGEITRHAQEHAMRLAAHAYNIADAMIAAREVKP